MVTGNHPEDVDLFDYIEEGLPGPRRAELEVHLASCVQCAEQVARVQAGRDALRRSQFLELPPHRREAVLQNLPVLRRGPARGPALSPKRLVAILTPIAAVAAVVVALVSTGELGGGGSRSPGGRETAAGAAAGTTSPKGASATSPEFDHALLSVAGPANRVAAELRSKGFDARAVGDRVEVRNATREQVKRAVRNRRSGHVQIVIIR